MDGKPQMDGTPQTKINDLWVPIFFGSPHIPTPKHQVFHVSNGSKTINLKRLGPIGLDLVSITTELLHCSGPFSLLGIGTFFLTLNTNGPWDEMGVSINGGTPKWMN